MGDVSAPARVLVTGGAGYVGSHICHALAGHGFVPVTFDRSLTLDLGTGQPTSVRQIVVAVEAISKQRVPLRYCSRRPGDPPVLYADPNRARNVLGFSAAFASIEDIVKTAWQFHLQVQGSSAQDSGFSSGAKELKCQ